MKIILFDIDDKPVLDIVDMNSAIISYNKIVNHESNYYFCFRLFVNPISKIYVGVYEEDIKQLNDYLKLVNFSFKLLFEAKNKLKLYTKDGDRIRGLIMRKYSTSHKKSKSNLEEEYEMINSIWINRTCRDDVWSSIQTFKLFRSVLTFKREK